MYNMMNKITTKKYYKGGLPLFSFVSDGKSCFSFKKLILTSERCAEHPFAGQNTQQPTGYFSELPDYFQSVFCLLGNY